MIGAIIGDIVGSRFEFKEHYGKDFPLFYTGCRPTDDSLMTLAVARALFLCGGNYHSLSDKAIWSMRDIGQKYPRAGWGGRFFKWLNGPSVPYNSYGNGAGMRISPVGWVAENEAQLKELAYKVTAISHNHPEGLKGAEAIAMAVYLARTGADKAEIKSVMAGYYPKINDKNFCIENLMGSYGYDDNGNWVSCQGSVPHAIIAFLEGTDFEDVIRNAVGIGGDSDTIGAMAGSIAEAYYGVPEKLENKALSYLGNELAGIYYAFNAIKRPSAYPGKK